MKISKVYFYKSGFGKFFSQLPGIMFPITNIGAKMTGIQV